MKMVHSRQTSEDGGSIKFGPHPKIQFLMGLKSTQCWPQSERTLAAIASRMFWWGILRKSAGRTTRNLPLQVVEHLNQRRWWLYKVWAPSKSRIFDGAQSTHCSRESERTISSLMFWWGIWRKSASRTTSNLPLQVVKHHASRKTSERKKMVTL